MAQGSLQVFEEFTKYIGDGSHNLNNSGGDTFYVMLINNTLVPIVSQAAPDESLYTEVNGTGYSANGAILTTDWSETGGTSTFKVTNDPITWTINGAGPTDVYYALIYNFSHTGSNDAVAFIDMTTDGGTTPISLQDADIVINFDAANGIFKLVKE